jgi:2-polyprenyl-3-methyl-5-hydroxy-6-metoxy-1,4-benzoquinol methylase
MIKRLLLILLNNRYTNKILILLGQDGFIKKFRNNWALAKLDPNKTLQENVGFSHQNEIQESINKLHKDIQYIINENNINEGKVLDIGCGTGLYLNDFDKNKFKIYGTDLNKSFLDEAKKLIPNGVFFNQDFLSINLDINFNIILCISVVEYVPPSKLKSFFKKVYSKLTINGIFILQYPHAISTNDLHYADLSYIRYSPKEIVKSLPEGMQLIIHKHFLDDRVIFDYDCNAYDMHMENSFRNGYLLVTERVS